jgi:leucyl aminopeptidase
MTLSHGTGTFMKFELTSVDASRIKGDFLAIPLFEEDFTGKSHRSLMQVDRALGRALIKTAAQEGFRAKPEHAWVFHTQGKIRAKRVMLLGLGPKAKFRTEQLRLAAGRAAKTIARARGSSVSFDLSAAGNEELPQWVAATVEGLILGGYRYDRYRTTQKEEQSPPLESVALHVPKGTNGALQQQVRLSTQIAEATNWSRDLVNEPAGVLTPTLLAREAERASKEAGLEISVRGRSEIRKLKMGMFLGVAQGSAEKPRLIQVSYRPKDPQQARKPPLALVGKAITFDSGGLSLKTAEGMLDMKTDMAGAAAVLGAMRVMAAVKPPFPVHAFIGACENMPSGTAYRPGDILVSRLGKTVEVTNTDAEGRLVLGDVLTWANEHKPSAIIDLATLTGACIIALGHHIAGVFGNDEQTVQGILEAARNAGEEAWPLPLSELQRESIRSDVADMKNAGDRWGGAISAAVFLKEFVGDTPWVHMDIAGPSVSNKERGYFDKGATGVGVRTLVEFIRKRASQATEHPSN